MGDFDRLPDSERDLWVADWERDQVACPDCGKPLQDCTDATRVWYSNRRVCYPSMELQAAQDAYGALHEARPFHDGTFTSWAKERSASHPYHYTHGVHIGIAETDVTPWDKFTTREDASPLPPGSGEQLEGSASQYADGEQSGDGEQ